MTAMTAAALPATHPAAPDGTSPTPRDHQLRALDDVRAGLAEQARGQLIMPCATGKTLVGRWAAERADARLTLVVLPSLNLVAQTLTEWRRPSGWPFRALIVCSDPSTAAGVAERGGEDGIDPFATRPAGRSAARRAADPVPVTTNPMRVARWLERRRPDRPSVLISTYHSAPVVAAGMRLADRPVTADLAVLDEAHRLAGGSCGAFRTVLDDHAIPTRRRLFLTATPRLLGNFAGHDRHDDDLGEQPQQLLSMDDERLFGPVLHRLTFADAIDQRLLANYRVLVVGRWGFAPPSELPDAVAFAALRDTVTRYGLRRILTFHNRVSIAERFAAELDARRGWLGSPPLWAQAVRARMPDEQRRRVLARLADLPTGGVGVVASARCLIEGVDVPAVDGVVFAGPRRSLTDVVQAVGRALRPAPGKQVATIVIPLTIPPGADDDDTLSASAFGHVWAVLRALRAHDERFAVRLDRVARQIARDPRGPLDPREAAVELALPSAMSVRHTTVRLVQGVSTYWERMFGLLERYVADHGHPHMPQGLVTDGERLGAWVWRQRAAGRQGLLPPDRAARLAALPGWRWSPIDAEDQRSIALLAEHIAKLGSAAERDRPPSIYRGVADARGRPMGLWVARKRQARRDGALDPELAVRLAALPGWQWQPLPTGDVDMVDRLRVYAEFEHHTNVPYDHVEDGVALGRWVADVRRRKYLGTLPPALEDEILAATPPNGPHGARVFSWDPLETRWRLGFDALCQFVARQGHADVPNEHDEVVDGATVHLAQWCSLQRHQHRLGRLAGERVRLLAAQPGWAWSKTTVRRVPTAAGRLPGGTPIVARAGRIRQPTIRPVDERVDAAPARTHLASLERHGIAREVLAAAAGVPVLRVHAVLDELTTVLRPADRQALTQLTLTRCRTVEPKVTAERVAMAAWDQAWAWRYELLADFAAEHGHASPTGGVIVDGIPLGQWVSQQRHRGRRGKLRADYRARLEALPGWRWSVR